MNKQEEKLLCAVPDGDDLLLVSIEFFDTITDRHQALEIVYDVYDELYCFLEDDVHEDNSFDFDVKSCLLKTIDILDSKFPGILNQLRSMSLKINGKQLFKC